MSTNEKPVEPEILATLSIHDYFPNSSVSRPDLHFLWAITPQRQRELVQTIKEPIKLIAMDDDYEAMRKDAARFRHLLQQIPSNLSLAFCGENICSDEDIVEAIDTSIETSIETTTQEIHHVQ